VPDGHASKPLTLHVHRDERIGDVIELHQNVLLLEGPLVGSDGAGFLVTGVDSTFVNNTIARRILATRIDSAGNVGPTHASVTGVESPSSFSMGFDGRSYLAVWRERDDDRALGWVKGFRLNADGSPIDATPFVIEERRLGYEEGIFPTAVGFDGNDFVVMWGVVSAANRTKLLVRRVGRDGSLRGKRAEMIYPDKGGRTWQLVLPELACRPGRCMVAWREGIGGDRDLYALALAGGVPLDPAARRVLNDAGETQALATDGTNFAIISERLLPCLALPTALGNHAVVARIHPDGTPFDLNGTVIDNAGGACPLALARGGLVFDGTNYAGFFMDVGPTLPDGTRETYAFAAHMAPDGTPLVDEPHGLMVHEAPTIDSQGGMTATAASRMHTLFVWAVRDPVAGTLQTVRARRVLPAATTPGYPEVEIGAIGNRNVAEGVELLLTVRAPAGFDPETTVLTATGLPPGALFDAPSGAFRWRPGGNDAGSHPGVTFAASDGGPSVAEAITIVVSEAGLSFEGLVRLANGTPVTDAGLKIGGVRGEKRIAFTDGAGRYRVENLPPKKYPVKLDRATKKRYRVIGERVRVTLEAADVVAVDLVVEPK
jgi:hypothetical protein